MNQKASSGSEIDVTVIGGGGHVGLPLALSFVEVGLNVLIFDINEKVLQTITSGRLPHLEHGAQPLLDRALESGRLHASSRFGDIPSTGAVIITIGTPVDEFQNPVHRVIRQCVDGLMDRLGEDQLIILRSTVYPGTTGWLDAYLKNAGKKVRLAFCPERVAQGHSIRELREVPHIIGGVTPEAADEAAALFAKLNDKLVYLSPLEAEFAKLFTNAYRYIHFAITNEFFMIADEAGLDYRKILDGLTQDYPRAEYMARPGYAAGPCLYKDTAQLSAFAKNRFSLGTAAIQVNEGLVLHTIEYMRKRFELPKMTVGLLGMAFKADIDDIRSSLSYKMRKAITLHAKEVIATDPLVKSDPTLLPVAEVVERSDVLVMCTPHSEYKTLDAKGKPVVDVWNFWAG